MNAVDYNKECFEILKTNIRKHAFRCYKENLEVYNDQFKQQELIPGHVGKYNLDVNETYNKFLKDVYLSIQDKVKHLENEYLKKLEVEEGIF